MDTLESLYPESLSNLELVIHYARVLGDAIGLGETCLSRLMTAARLRDVGLTTDNGIDSSEKAGSTHPEISERMLVMFGVPDEVLRAVRYHHENFDGSGYPEGLRGQDIPMEARILNLVERYVNAVKCEIKNGHGFHERAMQRILSTREHFDPHLLAPFEELHSRKGLYKC